MWRTTTKEAVLVAGKARFDPFMVYIIIAALLAFLVPATGQFGVVVDWATKAAIFLLFFGYGAKLSLAEAVAGLRHWRLHLAILVCTFVVFPVIGLGLTLVPDSVLEPLIKIGLVFLCLVPSTVQSSITFTSIAGGNVGGALVSATASNLLGVLITPLLALVVLPAAGGGGIGLDQFVAVCVQLLLPFVLGQLSRRWTAGFMVRNASRIKPLDQSVICLVVYSAFSEFFSGGAWREVTVPDLLLITGICLALLAFMLWFTWWLAHRLGFDRADSIAILFCGTKKSLATGVPMASVMFAGQAVGIIVLPLMIFHQAQLMACTWIAGRLARGAEAAEPAA